ncbi:hypothetical protein ABG79_01954 [Caloramator mitchellensis]|uniref:Mpv17 / PMP22 family protein n=1 Tax=Caloramator mitchellensis TaxID=908809 RepID=A0A0R3K1Q5_CALMK|nr:Mpv17/PMP22 family protein [Caloramator mitchellensis]KRQ86223.1 hypothetical protein ABG79_01954 [Caloramator mitchellensis]
MRKKDLLWLLTLALIIVFLIHPTTHIAFVTATKNHPYIMGFIKVSILATMGELLAIRIANGDYKKPYGLLYRFIIWGFLGMVFALVFDLFASGVTATMKKGLLPGGDSKFFFAFFTSSLMNLIFAPTFMALHRITDTYIDLGQGTFKKIFKVRINDVVNKIDWNGFIGFVVMKTIPSFWIPAHTVTFLLPSEYRVLMASFLSIALGAILSLAKRKK